MSHKTPGNYVVPASSVPVWWWEIMSRGWRYTCLIILHVNMQRLYILKVLFLYMAPFILQQLVK